MRPYSAACERNRDPILEHLRRLLMPGWRVLEIGSGTGQHAAYFGAALPEVRWLTSDLAVNHAGINAWLEEVDLTNVEPPMMLDVRERSWPIDSADAVFSANTAHIMAWEEVEAMLDGVARLLDAEAPFILYGPFRYGERHTSESNASFDADLRSRDPTMGVRDLHRIAERASRSGLRLDQDHSMPANNRLVVLRRYGDGG